MSGSVVLLLWLVKYSATLVPMKSDTEKRITEGGARRRGKRLGNAEMGGLCIDFFGKN